MKALSIRQPWAWAILNAGKCVENRAWDLRGGNIAQAQRLIGTTILIHAGKGCTRDEYESAAYAIETVATMPHDLDVPPLADLPRGFLVACARLVAVRWTTFGGHQIGVPKSSGRCLLCGATNGLNDCPTPDPWAIPDTAALILADVSPLPVPVPWSGALGFFEVPDSAIVVPT